MVEGKRGVDPSPQPPPRRPWALAQDGAAHRALCGTSWEIRGLQLMSVRTPYGSQNGEVGSLGSIAGMPEGSLPGACSLGTLLQQRGWGQAALQGVLGTHFPWTDVSPRHRLGRRTSWSLVTALSHRGR